MVTGSESAEAVKGMRKWRENIRKEIRGMHIKKNLTEQDFIEMEALEKRYYSEEYIADYHDAHDWYTDLPFTTVAAEDQGKIIGFLELFPVSDKVFALLKEGAFNDKYLEKSEIIDVSRPVGSPVNLFFSCIVIDEAYRKTDTLKMMLKYYAAFYSSLAADGLDIENVIIDNVTEDGERFSGRMGFERLTESDHGTVVYLSLIHI